MPPPPDPRSQALGLVIAELARQEQLLAAGRFRYTASGPIHNAERLAVLVEEVAEACEEIEVDGPLRNDPRHIALTRMGQNVTAAGNIARRINDAKLPPTPHSTGTPALLTEVVQVAAVAIAWATALVTEVTA